MTAREDIGLLRTVSAWFRTVPVYVNPLFVNSEQFKGISVVLAWLRHDFDARAILPQGTTVESSVCEHWRWVDFLGVPTLQHQFIGILIEEFRGLDAFFHDGDCYRVHHTVYELVFEHSDLYAEPSWLEQVLIDFMVTRFARHWLHKIQDDGTRVPRGSVLGEAMEGELPPVFKSRLLHALTSINMSLVGLGLWDDFWEQADIACTYHVH